MKMPPVLNPAPRAPLRADAAGYMLSSFELHAGVDVTALAITALPADLLRELVRLRKSWEATPALAA